MTMLIYPRRALLLLLTLPAMAHGAVIDNDDVQVFTATTSAPNSSSSPSSYQGYLANLLAAAGPAGFSTVGDKETDPAAFTPLAPGPVRLAYGFVTPYASWMGEAGPTGAFASEYGNRLQFNLIAIAKSPDVRLTLSGVRFSLSSVASPETGDIYTSIGSYSASTYSSRNIGVTGFGADGVLGGNDDTYLINGEAGTTAVLALILRGPGLAFDGTNDLHENAWDPSVTDAEKYGLYRKNIEETYPSGLDLTPAYKIDYSGSAGSITISSESITIVPEPSVFAVFAAGLPGITLFARYRRKRNLARASC